MALAFAAIGAPTSASAGDFFNGFEIDSTCWFTPTLVASGGGVVGATSASGIGHAEGTGGEFTRWGGYDDSDSCGSTAGGSFPPDGYDTSVDIYLDVDAGFANDTRFDFGSAISGITGNHRRDFIISCGFYDDNDGPGAGTNRFICSASNNAPGWPKDPNREPTVVATTTGWYTLRHQFRNDGGGVLVVDMSVLNNVGTVLHTWTNSTPSDVIGTTVGGNRYGWFVNNGFTALAFDNTRRTSIVAAPSLSCVGLDVSLFEAPLDTDVTVKKANRVLPLRMELIFDGEFAISSDDLASPPVLQVSYVGSATNTVDLADLDTAGKGDDGNMFAFNGSKWAFNMKTKGLASGVYSISAVSGDATEYVIDPTCEVSLTVQ